MTSPLTPNPTPVSRFTRFGLTLGMALTSSLGFSAGEALGQDAAATSRLEQENAELRKRLDALESVAKAEGLLPNSETTHSPVLTKLTGMKIEGFVSASYFYDTSTPDDDEPNAYLWNRNSGSFSINKFKLTLSSPAVEASGDSWDAGYKVSLIFGEDAPIVNTGGTTQGFDELREAFVELNVPVGTGLNVRAGQLISLLNYESGDGGAANANFSQGNQWFYTGNGPSAGVQFGYALTEKLDVKFRVQNGMYAGPIDGNDAKTFMGSLAFRPTEKLWLTGIGFGGEESDSVSLVGGSLLAGYQFTDKFGSALEFDYFHFDLASAPEEDLWSIGGWMWYDVTPKATLAVRAEYLSSDTGWGFGGLLGYPNSPDGSGSEIYGVTFTVTYKPLASVRIQPEVRLDGTTQDEAFDGEDVRVIVGIGVSYLF